MRRRLRVIEGGQATARAQADPLSRVRPAFEEVLLAQLDGVGQIFRHHPGNRALAPHVGTEVSVQDASEKRGELNDDRIVDSAWNVLNVFWRVS